MIERPLNVRLATPADEDAVYKLMQTAYIEQPIMPLNEHKIRDKIRLATERKGGVLCVIDGENGIEAYLIATLSQYWYTDQWHLEELSNFVHQDHRRTTHAKSLIEFIKWFAEQMGVPLIMGILSTQRLDAKIRLYRRQVTPVGAVFAYNTGHIDGLLSEKG